MKTIIMVLAVMALLGVGLLATTAIVGAKNTKKQFVFEHVVGISSPQEGITGLDIRTIRITELSLFREGGAGGSIGNSTIVSTKTKPAGTLGSFIEVAHDFIGMGTLYTTRVDPQALASVGIVHAIFGGTGAFQGAIGQCLVESAVWTCDLDMIAPNIPD